MTSFKASAQPLGIRAVVTYKFAKAALFGALAMFLLFTGVSRLHLEVLAFSQFLVGHVPRRIAEWLVEQMAKIGTPRAIHLLELTMLGDAVVSVGEAMALRRGYWWAPWLVVVATGTLLPFEVIAFVRKPHWFRLLLIVVNGLIVAYLAVRARKDRR